MCSNSTQAFQFLSGFSEFPRLNQLMIFDQATDHTHIVLTPTEHHPRPQCKKRLPLGQWIHFLWASAITFLWNFASLRTADR